MKDYVKVYIIVKLKTIIYDLDSPPPSPCFPLNAKVRIENGKSVEMFELQIGNKVQSGRIRKELSFNLFKS